MISGCSFPVFWCNVRLALSFASSSSILVVRESSHNWNYCNECIWCWFWVFVFARTFSVSDVLQSSHPEASCSTKRENDASLRHTFTFDSIYIVFRIGMERVLYFIAPNWGKIHKYIIHASSTNNNKKSILSLFCATHVKGAEGKKSSIGVSLGWRFFYIGCCAYNLVLWFKLTTAYCRLFKAVYSFTDIYFLSADVLWRT